MSRLFDSQEQRDELLSAYIDGQLSAGEQAALETRLLTDPALRAELDALRHTVTLVHDLPQAPLPRNFLLPQSMTAAPHPAPRRRAWAAPFLTAATAAVSLLFVGVLASDLLRVGRAGLAFAPAAEPQQAYEVAMESSPTRERAPGEGASNGDAVTPEIEEKVAAEDETDGAEGLPEDTAQSDIAETPEPVAEPLEVPAAAPEEPGEESAGGVEALNATSPGEEAPPGTAAGMGGGEPTAPVEEPRALPPTDSSAVPEPEHSAPTPTPAFIGEVPPEEREWESDDTHAEAEHLRAEETRAPHVTLWRVVEIGLGLAVLVLGAFTVSAWRRRRR